MAETKSTELALLEERLRAQAFTNRIRIDEFFRDFDKLRTGYVSGAQFSRCLAICGFVLTPAQYEMLIKHYRDRGDEKVHYSLFCDSIDSVFTTKGLEKQPIPSGVEPSPRGETSPVRTKPLPAQLDSDSHAKLDVLMQQLRASVKTRGLIVKNFFKGFDVHNYGKVTKSQFSQCVPFRLTKEETDLLLTRYGDGLDFCFMDFHNDLETLDDGTLNRPTTSVNTPSMSPSRTRPEYGPAPSPSPTWETAEDRLKSLVMKHRVRLEEPFRDYDSLRSGIVTAAQYEAALGMIKFPRYNLTRTEIEALSDHYAVYDPNGYKRVNYKAFLDSVDKVFTEKGLEKSPLKTYRAPTQLVERIRRRPLDPSGEAIVAKVLETLAIKTQRERVLLKPIFQDYDKAIKGTYTTEHTSRDRFLRALATLDFSLSEIEADAVCAKYDDLGNGDINYVQFCEDVDPELYAPQNNVARRTLPSSIRPSSSSGIPLPGSSHGRLRDLQTRDARRRADEVEDEIKAKCVIRRIRIEEFFRDYDPLRSGVCTKTQFRAGLDSASFQLNEVEFEELVKRYQMTRHDEQVIRWRDFSDKIDSVFTEKHLETSPLHVPPSPATITQKMTEMYVEPRKTDTVEEIVRELGYKVRTHGTFLKPFFQDFDRHNSGRVTRSQFLQVLDRLDLHLSPIESSAVIDAYVERRTNDVNYLRFMRDVDATLDPAKPQTATDTLGRPSTSPVRNVVSFDTGSARPMSRSTPQPIGGFTPARTGTSASTTYPVLPVPSMVPSQVPITGDPLEDLHIRIRSHVVKKRIRMQEFFVDYDKLRRGVILEEKFRSGLRMALESSMTLTHDEIDMLVEKYRDERQRDLVRYMPFCEFLEAAFTEKGLEKSPTKIPLRFDPFPTHAMVYREDLSARLLTPNASRTLSKILQNYVFMTESRRLYPKPLFTDYDPVNKERVTQTQFRSVLDVLGLRPSDAEFELLTRRFGDERGDINYQDFCDVLEKKKPVTA